MSRRIPYAAHVSDALVRTRAGHYLQVIRLAGCSFECADEDAVNNWHERLNVLYRSIASPQLAVWVHLIRQRECAYPSGVYDTAFAAQLNARYRERVSGQRLLRNDLYLSLVYRPTAGAAPGMVAALVNRTRRGQSALELKEALETCEQLRQTVTVGLGHYDPEVLSCYARDGRHYSRVLEFLTYLLESEQRAIPLPRAPLYDALGTSRVTFGLETLEYRSPTHTRIAAFIGVKEYPPASVPGMFNGLLTAPFPLTLTQSFAFLTRGAAQGLLLRQFNQMHNAGDLAVSQTDQLKVALDELSSGVFVLGEHHFALQVLTDPQTDSGQEAHLHQMRILNQRVGEACDLLRDAQVIVAREDLALEDCYWAQLPGSMAARPRRAAISSRNFAAMAACHNFPTGRAQGNHWGEATTMFMTLAGSPYHYGLHASDPTEPDGGSRRDVGHTLVCGPTGSGKTVWIGFLIAMLTKQGATQIVLDKDRGLEILIRALGGEYLPLRNGQPTGLNPLQLPAAPEHLPFLRQWLSLLTEHHRPLSVSQQADLDQALRGVLALAPEHRRLSRLAEFVDSTDPDGVHARLAPWCDGGDDAWVFDHVQDTVMARLSEARIFAFDGTDLLANDRARPAVGLYLFHLVRQLLDGRRLVFWCDEFSRWLSDAAFTAFGQDGLKTWRKRNGVFVAATQSPHDALSSSISRTIIEQTATKILFPSPEARREDYVEGLGLSEREFRLLKEELAPGSRAFLIKRGAHSAVCELDLHGFDEELAVISGRAESVARMYELMALQGPAPQQWLAPFYAAIRGPISPNVTR